MISTLLDLLRLCPFLCGGHRQLALENLALRQQLNVSIFDYLTEEKDPSDFKYRVAPDVQLEMFRLAVEWLGKGKAVPALCKEDQSLWEQLG